MYEDWKPHGLKVRIRLIRLTEMPMRKADQNIEEWLREGPVAVESSRAVAETNCNQVASSTVLTAKGASLRRGSDPRTDLERPVATSTDVAASKSEVAVPGVP